MGFHRPQVKEAAKAAIRQAHPSPRWITLLFFLLVWGVPGALMLLAARPLLNLAALAARSIRSIATPPLCPVGFSPCSSF